MIETAELSEEYAELAWQVIREQPSLQWIEAAEISIGFLKSDREKVSRGGAVLGACERVKDRHKCFIPYDFLIIIYAPNVLGMDRETLKKLLHHELLHVGMDDRNGVPKYVTVPHDVEDFREIIDLYGLDWAKR